MPGTPLLRPSRWVSALTALAVALLGTVVLAPAAQADGTPDVAITVGAPAEALQGAPFPVTLSATNPGGPDAYNASFRLLVPTGAALTTATPAPSAGPIAVTGGAVYLWSNVTDLLTGTTSSVTATIDPGTLPLGAVTVDGGAYVHSDPRTLPRFDAAGDPIPASYTGWAEDSGVTQLVPFTLTKDVIAPENELIRGVHDHRTAVTLRIDNNLEGPSNAYSVVDYIPAVLEFLECGTEDNSLTVTEEYTGSGPLNAAAFTPPAASAGCPTPSSVETVEVDPPGAQPFGVYTMVTWDNAALATVGAGNLAAGGNRTFHYVVGIPQNANTTTFIGGAPSPASGDQGSNLDNNGGASTLETGEQQSTNSATLSGSYDDPHAAGGSAVYSDTGTDTVTLEDLAIQKGASTPTITQGDETLWTLDIEVSEYTATATGIDVTDTLPDGLCPLGAGSADVECQGGAGPSLPYSSATENADGTWTLTWGVPNQVTNGTYQITFTSRAREYYQENGADDTANPVRANDAWTNTVDIDGTVTEVINGVVQAPREVLDDSAAGQAAGDIELKKYVAAPSAGACSTADSMTGWVDGVHATDFGPGDLVCWRLDITTPSNLDTTNLQLTDFLPAGYEYVSFATRANSALSFPAPTVDGSSITWNLSGAGDLDQARTASVIMTSRIADPSAHSSADIVENLGKLAYANTPGAIFQLRDPANAPWKEPVLGLTKSASPTVVDGGDVVGYTVTLLNTGDQEAVDVSVRDVLPTGISCADVVPASIPAGFACSDQSPRDWLQGTVASVPAGGTATLTYQVDVPNTVAPGTVLTNNAGVRTYDAVTNDPGDTRFTYVPTSNIDPLLTPNTTAASDDAVVTVRNATLDKSATTSQTDAGNTATQATPGEVVHYTLDVVLPAETTLTNASIVDAIQTELLLNQASASITTDQTSAALAVTTTAAEVRVTFPATYTVGASDERVVVEFDAVVRNTSAVDVDGQLRNRGYLYWNSTNATDYVDTRIVQPNIDITKAVTDADADGRAEPAELLTYQAVVTNVGTNAATTWTSTAFDTVAVDIVPTSMTPVDAGGVALVDGAAVPSGGVWNEAARTLTWTGDAGSPIAALQQLAVIAPNGTVTLPYQTRVEDPLPSPTSFTNTVHALTSSLPGAVADERISTAVTAPLGRYHDEASATLVGPDPSITKDVAPTQAVPGETATYTLTTIIPANVQTYAVVQDTLPAGLQLVTQNGSTCTTGGSPCGGGENLTATPLTASGQTIGWVIGSITPFAAERQVTVTYTARVVGTGGPAHGATLHNTAEVLFEDVTPGAAPTSVTDIPGLGLSGSDTDPADLTVLGPTLTLAKEVRLADGTTWDDERRVLPGETVRYRITLTNTGTATAHDVVVPDLTDARFGTVTLISGATLTDATAPTLEFTVASIAASASQVIEYEATVPAGLTDADEVAGPELVNTADATYSSLPGADPNERSYDDVVEDSVGLEIDLARLGDTVWYDANGDGVQSGPAEAGVAGVTVTAVWAGPDGLFGTGDDVTYPAATTDAAGEYHYETLPEGLFRVSVSNLPAGTGLTYDDDSGTASPDGVTVVTLTSAAPEYLDADFGIRGTGSVGDLVWLDHDADGVVDAGEPGVGGVDVTVSWPATGGLPGGSVTTTTAADGTWSVGNLPAADITVTVDPATYPAGTALVSERHGGTVDGTATFPLGAGATDPDYDFGLRGTASVGNRVWVDTDRDGVQDSGEPGIPGATVEVRWLGADGVTGTADDLVVTTTTGIDGAYLVEHLPAGDYVVTVTALPTALAPTFDEDSTTVSPDGRTAFSLATGEFHDTADFGYVADTGVGDRVWLDTDRDGVQDAGEPGLPGVVVTVTSAGADGVLGTADDIARVTTTDADGDWAVTGLPAELTRVEVGAGLPAGVEATFDADGLATPGVSEVTLVNGAFTDTQDFGYAGPNAIGDYTWVDLDRDGVQDADEPALGGLTVVVTHLGPDGVAGGGDDVTLTTVTAADGSYLVDGLPDGAYTVVVTAGVPAGYAPSWDETGTADGMSTVACLGCTEAGPVLHDTADFGYSGTGALGGTVWLERTVDGALVAPIEAGLPGIGIVVTWAGPDGVLGTADDAEIRTVTGPGGVWLVEGMPPGPFTAAVDPVTLPAGTSVVWDRESGTSSPDGVLTGALAPGERRLDVDTGVRGSSSIGDLVWVDKDRDGVQDATDPVAPNVRVTVTWHGADGTLGTADDVSIEVRTGADGRYLADGLPAGRYTVTFDKATFPKGTVAHSDLDGGDLVVATVDLGLAQDRTDVDLVLRTTGLAATGATIGWLLLASLLLVGVGVYLRLRSARLAYAKV